MSTQTKTFEVTDTSGRDGSTTHTVVQASYHRNGVGGAGFIVALIDSSGGDHGPEPRRFLLTWFPTYDDQGERTTGYQENVSVLAVDEIAKGNVAMFPVHDPATGSVDPSTGGNAWRGADNWAIVLPVIRQWLDDERAALTDALALNQQARIGRQV